MDPFPYNTGRPSSALRDHPLAVSEDRLRSHSPILRSADRHRRRSSLCFSGVGPSIPNSPLTPFFFFFFFFFVLSRFVLLIYVFRWHPPSRKSADALPPSFALAERQHWTVNVDGDPALTGFNVGPPRGPLSRQSSFEIPQMTIPSSSTSGPRRFGSETIPRPPSRSDSGSTASLLRPPLPQQPTNEYSLEDSSLTTPARHGWDAIIYPVFHAVTHAINTSPRLLQKVDAAFGFPQFRLHTISI